MKRNLWTSILLLIYTLQSNAQDEFDAIRYGYTNYGGSARSASISNAMGSVGGDFTSLSINPAGIGVYRRGELSFTPSFTINNNNSTYLGTSRSANTSKLNISHFGIVLTASKKGNAYKKAAWKAASFAFGMNRNTTFKNDYSYSGTNYKNSLIEKYAEEFNQLGGIKAINSVSYPAYAAYQTWLVDRGFGIDSNKAYSYIPFTDGIKQTKTVSESGGMQEYVISGGGNYKEKLMIGATLGIPRIVYDRTLRFTEEDISGKNNNDFKYMYFTERLSTTATGINLKVGAIYKASDNFRLGLALHTPTYLQFNDISSIEMESHTDSLLLQNNPTNNPVSLYTQDTALSFNYAQTTPYKAIASATVLFNKYGFLTADVELVDYASMKYNFGQGYENESEAINRVIQNTYKSAINVRLGAEAKLQDVALRAGVAYFGSPYKDSNIGGSRLHISAGAGYRAKNWFMDFAFVRAMQNVTQLPYVLNRQNANVETAMIKNTNSSVLLTFGFKL